MKKRVCQLKLKLGKATTLSENHFPPSRPLFWKNSPLELEKIIPSMHF